MSNRFSTTLTACSLALSTQYARSAPGATSSSSSVAGRARSSTLVANSVILPSTSSAVIWMAISGMALLNSPMTLWNRDVTSSATMTAMCSYCGLNRRSTSQYSRVRMMWDSSVAPSWISTS